MTEAEPEWLLLDGYEDEPAAFGVPPYVGFHIRYIAGVFESQNIPYRYITIDQWRRQRFSLQNSAGIVVFAGAVVPGKYLRGTPISEKEVNEVLRAAPPGIPVLCGGWAIRLWRQAGWLPLRKNLFLAVQDTDATLSHYLDSNEWKNKRRSKEQWSNWASTGASSRAVTDHPDLNGPLTYEVEVYQGCVRYKQGCKFCIEPKKGVPIWRTPEDIINEVKLAHDNGVKHVRLGGMTDVFTYMAEGVVEMEYPIPNPEPIANLLHGLREDERLDILAVDNGNPSIIAENIEPSTEITKTLCDTLSDGSVLSFGLESADPTVHTENWLNCSAKQLKSAVRLINKYGREKGQRGLPKLLPGLNFIAGLNGETTESYNYNKELLTSLRDDGLQLRRINIRQVEGEGFQKIEEKAFRQFKEWVRDEIDAPLLQEIFPIGQVLKRVYWESHDNRIRLPSNLSEEHRNSAIHGKAGVTFGRQIGAYPILIGASYQIPLESESDIVVTSHGKRSITGVELGLDINTVSQAQLQAIPGIGEKTAWKIVSNRAKILRKNRDAMAFGSLEDAFEGEVPELAFAVFDA